MQISLAFEYLLSDWESCNPPTYHPERGAYFEERNFLRWTNFRATSEYYINVWARPHASGYIFNHNYETRPVTTDRDSCDENDDLWKLHSKKGDFAFFFDECEEEEKWDDWYGWKMISVAFNGFDPYQRKIMINGDVHHIDTLELSGDIDPQTGSTDFNNFIV